MLTLNDGRSELWQWDTKRKLTVDADCSQVHFSNKVFGRSIDVDVVDGVAIIPDILLQTDKDLTAWAFVGTAKNGYTKISKVFNVNRRNKPADYVFTPTDQTTLGELVERLERIEETRDPDAIKNAVDDYLASNPIQIDEKDPTVPAWAKQPQKPSYTAAEVGAQPEGNYVKTVNGETPDKNGNVQIKTTDSGKNAILYTPQELTEEQKDQARENIGAAPMSLFNIIESDIVDSLTSIMPAEDAFTVGKYCNYKNGNIVDVASYRCTEDYIAFPAGAKLMTHYSGSATKTCYPLISYYDANKVYIGGENGPDLNQEDYEGKLCAFYDVPEDARFIRLSVTERTFSDDYFKDLYLYAVTDAKVNGVVKIPDLIVPLSALENSDILLSGALPLLGKTIVNFGDSIFGNARPPKDISTMLANLTGATVKNCAFGGCRMAVHVGHWDAFSMYRLAHAIANNDYSLQDEAINYDDRTSYAEEPLALIKETDFSKVDIVTIAYGTNDWTGNNALDNADNLYDTTTVCGALRYSVETLLTAFPQLRIFVLLPTYRFWMDDTGAFTEDSETKTNSHEKTLEECRQAITDVAEDYNLPVIDNYKRLGINKFNRTQYFPANDGSHHNENGRIAIAAHIAKNLW